MGEASDWLERLRSETTDETEVRAWLGWCDENPDHRATFGRVRHLDAQAQQLRQAFPLGDVELSQTRVAETQESAAVVANPPRRPPTSLGRFAHWLSAALMPLGVTAVTAAIVATVVVHLSVPQAGAPDATPEIVLSVPAVAQWAELGRTPSSGSSTHTDAQRGEAYFAVAPDANRPFVVSAGKLRAQAVGTAFNVRRAGECVVISVTEGVVDVSWAAAASADTIRIAAGSQLRWGSTDGVPVLMPARSEDVLDWREGRLTYTEEPIGAVIADLNRYSKRQLRIGSNAIWHIRFTGTLFTQATEDWLHGLPGVFPVRIVEDERGYAILPRT